MRIIIICIYNLITQGNISDDNFIKNKKNIMTQMPIFIIGFREGLEAFLLIAITLKYITSIDQGHLKN